MFEQKLYAIVAQNTGARITNYQNKIILKNINFALRKSYLNNALFRFVLHQRKPSKHHIINGSPKAQNVF